MGKYVKVPQIRGDHHVKLVNLLKEIAEVNELTLTETEMSKIQNFVIGDIVAGFVDWLRNKRKVETKKKKDLNKIKRTVSA